MEGQETQRKLTRLELHTSSAPGDSSRKIAAIRTVDGAYLGRLENLQDPDQMAIAEIMINAPELMESLMGFVDHLVETGQGVQNTSFTIDQSVVLRMLNAVNKVAKKYR